MEGLLTNESNFRKTFLLVHGAFIGGWCWRRASDLLEKEVHKVFSPTLTGLGDRSHLLSKDINLDTHITDIVNVIRWENLEDICLVVHSYGGFPGSGRRPTSFSFHSLSLCERHRTATSKQTG